MPIHAESKHAEGTVLLIAYVATPFPSTLHCHLKGYGQTKEIFTGRGSELR